MSFILFTDNDFVSNLWLQMTLPGCGELRVNLHLSWGTNSSSKPCAMFLLFCLMWVDYKREDYPEKKAHEPCSRQPEMEVSSLPALFSGLTNYKEYTFCFEIPQTFKKFSRLFNYPVKSDVKPPAKSLNYASFHKSIFLTKHSFYYPFFMGELK